VKPTPARIVLGLSLLIGGFTLLLFARSLWRRDSVLLQRRQQSQSPGFFESHEEIWVSSGSGQFEIKWATWRDSVFHRPSNWVRIVSSSRVSPMNLRFGAVPTWQGRPGSTFWMVGFTLAYPLVLLLCSLPWLIQWRERKRQRRAADLKLCRNCGYDLRATPVRCPECGAAGDQSSHLPA